MCEDAVICECSWSKPALFDATHENGLVVNGCVLFDDSGFIEVGVVVSRLGVFDFVFWYIFEEDAAIVCLFLFG